MAICAFCPSCPVETPVGHPLTTHSEKIFSVSPKLYRRQLSSALASVPNRDGFAAASRESLLERLRDWEFEVGDDEKLTALYRQLGLL